MKQSVIFLLLLFSVTNTFGMTLFNNTTNRSNNNNHFNDVNVLTQDNENVDKANKCELLRNQYNGLALPETVKNHIFANDFEEWFNGLESTRLHLAVKNNLVTYFKTIARNKTKTECRKFFTRIPAEQTTARLIFQLVCAFKKKKVNQLGVQRLYNVASSNQYRRSLQSLYAKEENNEVHLSISLNEKRYKDNVYTYLNFISLIVDKPITKVTFNLNLSLLAHESRIELPLNLDLLFKDVEHLDFSKSKIDSLPEDILKMKHLKSIKILDTSIDKSGIPEAIKNIQLEDFYFSTGAPFDEDFETDEEVEQFFHPSTNIHSL